MWAIGACYEQEDIKRPKPHLPRLRSGGTAGGLCAPHAAPSREWADNPSHSPARPLDPPLPSQTRSQLANPSLPPSHPCLCLGQHQFSSVAQSCLILFNPMDCCTPGVPVPHQLPELTQTHVHRVGDAIQPPHPLVSPSPTFNLSQNQGLFQ